MHSAPSAWGLIATIVCSPVLMTTLFMLQGEVLIMSARPSPRGHCPFLSASPTHGCVLREKHHFSLRPFSQALSLLLSGLETPDRKECALSPFRTRIHALLWGPCFAAAATRKLFLQSQHPGWDVYFGSPGFQESPLHLAFKDKD